MTLYERKQEKRKPEDSFRGNLYVTVDTEIDADIHWVKGHPESFSSVIYGIPQILRPLWNSNRINPIYFVSPEVLKNSRCCNVLKEEIRQGAIIGAHLHAEYIDPDGKSPCEVERQAFPCTEYSTEIEREKIQNLRELIIEKLGIEPVWYRAARFGADEDTMVSLVDLGFLYDSSYTPCISWKSKGGPDHSAVPNGRHIVSVPDKKKPIIEYPVTIMGKRWGLFGKFLPDNWLFYQWLRPTHMTYIEQRRLLDLAKNKEIKDVVMMFHSVEIMINKSPYVRNRIMLQYYLWRLDRTLKYADRIGYSGRIK
ncbi:hypothetical protein D3Z51_00610 [Clostridiaceae bacterium]|nr:hypothetical protein [Clostridiaceae bacterium]RKI16464.1 hypothetical protein D7V81_04295 [bacterium 1XD21-70]